jgi:hypothetical protein
VQNYRESMLACSSRLASSVQAVNHLSTVYGTVFKQISRPFPCLASCQRRCQVWFRSDSAN